MKNIEKLSVVALIEKPFFSWANELNPHLIDICVISWIKQRRLCKKSGYYVPCAAFLVNNPNYGSS